MLYPLFHAALDDSGAGNAGAGLVEDGGNAGLVEDGGSVDGDIVSVDFRSALSVDDDTVGEDGRPSSVPAKFWDPEAKAIRTDALVYHDTRDMLSGHICRCTGYVGMVQAIMDTVEERNAKTTE